MLVLLLFGAMGAWLLEGYWRLGIVDVGAICLSVQVLLAASTAAASSPLGSGLVHRGCRDELHLLILIASVTHDSTNIPFPRVFWGVVVEMV